MKKPVKALAFANPSVSPSFEGFQKGTTSKLIRKLWKKLQEKEMPDANEMFSLFGIQYDRWIIVRKSVVFHYVTSVIYDLIRKKKDAGQIPELLENLTGEDHFKIFVKATGQVPVYVKGQFAVFKNDEDDAPNILELMEVQEALRERSEEALQEEIEGLRKEIERMRDLLPVEEEVSDDPSNLSGVPEGSLNGNPPPEGPWEVDECFGVVDGGMQGMS